MACNDDTHFILKVKGLCYLIDVEEKKAESIVINGLNSLILGAGTHNIFQKDQYFCIDPIINKRLEETKLDFANHE